MKCNFQPSTFNAQRRNGARVVGLASRLTCPAVLAALPLHAQTNDQPALVPACAELPPTFWEQHGTLVIICVFALLVVAAVVAWAISRAKPSPVLPPEQIARDALARLQSLPEDRKLLSEVSQILRRYVGAAFEFPGAEMTTAEFCACLSREKKMGTELSGTIASFLQECDVRKFSPANSPGRINAVQRALELVNSVEKLHGNVEATK